MRRQGKIIGLGMLVLPMLVGLSGCKSSPADDPRHDAQTEAAREHDCADPQWKAANLGLWYNICSGGSDQPGVSPQQ
jgi:hypothetical protein